MSSILCEQVNFETALSYLKKGHSVTRSLWLDCYENPYLVAIKRTVGTVAPYPLYLLKCANGMGYPYTASQPDLLSDDWIVYTYKYTEEIKEAEGYQ